MFRSNKLKFLVSSVAALALFVAVGVSPAAAEEANATFSGSSIKLTTSGITVKKNGSEAKSCTLFGGSAQGPISASYAWPSNSNFSYTLLSCTGGTALEFWMQLVPKYDTTTGQYTLRLGPAGVSSRSPYGAMTETATGKGTWTNGSGATNSTVTFNEAQVGLLNSTGASITISGTFTATTSTGTLLTLSH